MSQDERPEVENEAFKRNRRRRSIAIAVTLAVLVAIFYALTVVKIGPTVLVREL